MSKPTIPDVSRHVHFIPSGEDCGLMVQRGSQPLHAVVIFVVNERTVNLSITDHDGFIHTRLGAALVQPGDEVPTGSHCRWMPYQLAQFTPGSAALPSKGDGALSPVLADLIASTATGLSPEDLAGVRADADTATTPAESNA